MSKNLRGHAPWSQLGQDSLKSKQGSSPGGAWVPNHWYETAPKPREHGRHYKHPATPCRSNTWKSLVCLYHWCVQYDPPDVDKRYCSARCKMAANQPRKSRTSQSSDARHMQFLWVCCVCKCVVKTDEWTVQYKYICTSTCGYENVTIKP